MLGQETVRRETPSSQWPTATVTRGIRRQSKARETRPEASAEVIVLVSIKTTELGGREGLCFNQAQRGVSDDACLRGTGGGTTARPGLYGGAG